MGDQWHPNSNDKVFIATIHQFHPRHFPPAIPAPSSCQPAHIVFPRTVVMQDDVFPIICRKAGKDNGEEREIPQGIRGWQEIFWSRLELQTESGMMKLGRGNTKPQQNKLLFCPLISLLGSQS